jgi:hypothetical protein
LLVKVAAGFTNSEGISWATAALDAQRMGINTESKEPEKMRGMKIIRNWFWAPRPSRREIQKW